MRLARKAEVRLLVEDELIDALEAAVPMITRLLQLVGKMDVLQAFLVYLRSLPTEVPICRPEVLSAEFPKLEIK